jgi:glycosyltransferase involved in cell wall biosynthesis
VQYRCAVQTPPTIALVDFRQDGHHLTNLRFFHKTLRQQGYSVVNFCPAPEKVEPFLSPDEKIDSIFVRFPEEVERHRWVRKTSASENRHRFRRVARQLFRFEALHKTKIDLVFLNSLYNGALASPESLPNIFPFRWITTLLDSWCVSENRLANARRMRTWDSLAAFQADNCAGMAVFDPWVVEKIQKRLGNSKPVYWIPEVPSWLPPNRNFAAGERVIARAAGRSIIGCVGQFGLRKGALEFIRVAQLCRDEPWLFTWVGELDLRNTSAEEHKFISDFVSNPPSNCFFDFPGRLDEPDFDRVIELSAVVWACYRQHMGSSNMVRKAGFFEKPVVVHDLGGVAQTVRRYGLGTSIREGAPWEQYRDAIRRALAGDCFSPQYTQFQKEYAPDRSRRVVSEMVANALGLTSAIQAEPSEGCDPRFFSTERTSTNVGI